MATTFYLKNTSGSTVTVADIGVQVPNNQSIQIDHNATNGFLSNGLSSALNAGTLVLSTTDIGDVSGDLSSVDAIRALTISSYHDTDNPHQTTLTQAIAADTSAPPITVPLLIDVVDAATNVDVSNPATFPPAGLHNHDTRYFTKTNLETSGQATVDWGNIANAPQFGSVEWQQNAECVISGTATTLPTTGNTTGEFYLNTTDNHVYLWNGTSWVDQGAPTANERIVYGAGASPNNEIYTWNGTTWTGSAPSADWALIIDNDGFDGAAQYVYETTTTPPAWVKIADISWGTHNNLGGRDAANAHPATAISYDNTTSHLNASDVQAAIDAMVASVGVLVSNYLIVAKDGYDSSQAGEVRGGFETPFLTIQAAINAIPTTGPNAASSGNRYAIWMAPGDYNENVTLNKAWVFLVADQNGGTEIVSSTGTSLTLSSTIDSSTGVYGLRVISTSTSGTDNAILVAGSNPYLLSVNAVAASGARAIYFTGNYNQLVRSSTFSGPMRIDAGTVTFLDSEVFGYTNVTGGSLRVVQGYFYNNGGDAIAQTGGTVTLVSAKLVSGTGAMDYNQTAGTVNWGWIEYSQASGKTNFGGTKTLLFPAGDLYFNNTSFGGPTSTTVQAAINNLFQQSGTKLTNYIVGKDSFDPFSSIEAAITQASTDGHGFSNPAVVLVKPGTYTENVTMLPGINVISLMNDKAYQTELVGTLTYSCTTGTYGSNLCSWLGIDVKSSSPAIASLVFSGTAPQRLNVSNCEVDSASANPALEMNNSGTGSTLVNSNVNFNNTSTGLAAKIDAGTFSLFKTQTIAYGNTTAVQFNNAAQIQGMLNYSQGNLDFNGTSGGLFGQLTIANGTNVAIDFDSTGQLFIMDGIQTGTGAIKGGAHPGNVYIHPNAGDVYYNNAATSGYGITQTTVQGAIDQLITTPGVLSFAYTDTAFVSQNFTGVTSTGAINAPFATIQAAINHFGQPTTAADYQRSILIIVLDSGTYTENLTIPAARTITIRGTGLTINGSITRYVAAELEFGVASSTFRSCFTLEGSIDAEDFHQTTRNGIRVTGTYRCQVASGYTGNTTHDTCFIGTEIDGTITSDDGVVNSAAPAVGNEILYVYGSYLQGNIEGRYFYCQRWRRSSIASTSMIVGWIVMFDEIEFNPGSASTAFALTVAQEFYNFVNNSGVSNYYNFIDSVFTSTTTLTVSVAQQIRLDAVTKLSWDTYVTVTGAAVTYIGLDGASGVSFTPPTGMTSTTVQGAISELYSDLENFLSTGTVFPPSPAPGDMFYRTDLNLTFQYDGSRSKWLSVTQMFLDWGSNNASGSYLNIHGAAATQTGYLMPRNGTILSVTAICASGNQSKQLEIRKNNIGTTPLKTFSLSSGSYSSINDNIDFNTTDYIQAFATSSGQPARDVVVMVIIGWRG
jgi:hypothetical protein